MFGGSLHRIDYAYDAIDNLRAVTHAGVRELRSKNRLTNVTACCVVTSGVPIRVDHCTGRILRIVSTESSSDERCRPMTWLSPSRLRQVISHAAPQAERSETTRLRLRCAGLTEGLIGYSEGRRRLRVSLSRPAEAAAGLSEGAAAIRERLFRLHEGHRCLPESGPAFPEALRAIREGLDRCREGRRVLSEGRDHYRKGRRALPEGLDRYREAASVLPEALQPYREDVRRLTECVFDSSMVLFGTHQRLTGPGHEGTRDQVHFRTKGRAAISPATNSSTTLLRQQGAGSFRRNLAPT